jgi:uncharacterized membrane protein YeaQ/YmgE (transglycosylase-associated protein family)
VENFLPIIVHLANGAAGGAVGGAVMKNLSLGIVLNSVVGLLGGALGGQLLGLFGLGVTGAALDLPGVVRCIAAGAAGGVVLLAMVGAIKHAIAR